MNIRIGYKINETIQVRLDIDNIADAKAEDVSYYYASRLNRESLNLVGTGINDIHYHAAEPRGFRLSLVARW